MRFHKLTAKTQNTYRRQSYFTLNFTSLVISTNVPDLRSQAYVNILRQCDFGCSSPDPPIELCASIRYIYKYLRVHKDLIDLVVNYCITNFLRHRLADDEDFQNLPTKFHQLLCEICMHHDIDNDIACAMVQLPCQVKTPRVIREHACDMDVFYRFHGTMDHDLPKKIQRIQPPEQISNLSLALRPRDTSSNSTTDESESDVDGFYLVSKGRKSSSLDATRSPISEVPGSGDGFQIIASSPATQGAPESDSDVDTFVETARSEAGGNGKLSAFQLSPGRSVTTWLKLIQRIRTQSGHACENHWMVSSALTMWPLAFKERHVLT
ncbi:hypothetical protein EJ03DRAFT_329049 [Teratosphaeria nubilosa]|uniref:Uncharacterized protein n=1 Tax=Teratosphaeria nubilosa TaxID=161662 RepID=A0A6G1L415_9PEZI|nr:hypothetical protein EJ03DRAFT_329049 [Teratosphaeria nubilosa]